MYQPMELLNEIKDGHTLPEWSLEEWAKAPMTTPSVEFTVVTLYGSVC